jgi:transcription initiation factor TFIIIB Brf1 subunit/transcription initiation factor TFIIB
LVLISYYVDEEPEWRTFGIEDNINEYDPNHLGSLSDPLLTHANLATTISKPAKGGTTTVAISKNWLINRQSNPDRDLIQGFEIIETMARRLCFAPFMNRAREIYMNVQEQGKQCQRLVYSSLVRRISCQEH